MATGVASSARRRANVSPFGGDGVESGADERAVVPDDVEGIL